MTITELAEKVVGMDYHEAMETVEAAGFCARIVLKDGNRRPMGEEKLDNRINFAVDCGVVVETLIG